MEICIGKGKRRVCMEGERRRGRGETGRTLDQRVLLYEDKKMKKRKERN